MWGQTSGDPRRIGVRPTGSYWGASGEEIDLVSGNLNFWLPLLTLKPRGGADIPFGLSYNSQNWRQNSSGTTNLGQDVGYGYGWKLQAGSILPVYSGSTIDHYVYSDSTGAQYRLDQNTGNVWASREGIYVSYDANANRVYFPDGSFWVMGNTSGPNEADAGTRYPTVIEDRNGNQTLLYYYPNYQSNGGSARLYAIADPRAVNACGGGTFNYTFYFVYNNDSTPHLTNIYDCTYGSGGHTLTYFAPQTLTSPFSSQTFGSATFLQTVSTFDNRVQSFTYGTSGEMTRTTTPLGGSLGWQYRTYTYGNGVSYREVQTRQMTPISGGSTYTWNLTLDSNPTVHGSAVMADVGAGTQKAWTFQTAAGPFTGLATGYDEGTSGASLMHNDYTWVQDSVGNVYLGTAATTLDPGTSNAVQTKTVQSLDTYGNLLQSQLYDYGATAATRTYTFTYLTSATYTSRYIRNRLVTASVQDAAGQISLGNYTYDYGYNSNCSSGPADPLDRPGLAMHDTNYNTSFTCRGNPTGIGGVGTTWPEKYYDYDIGGVAYQTHDIYGLAASLTVTGNTNYSLPEVLTPNGNSNLATTLTYATSFAVNSIASPNGATVTTHYDQWGRPSYTTIADGATTNYAYSYNPNTQAATLTDAQSSRWIKTIVDGFGRTISVIKGHDSTTISEVDTQYAPCACSPLGKISKVSQPYAPGATPVWTSYTYDGRGRPVTVVAPDGSTTRYAYQGNTTTVTDPAGKWKTYTADASGNTVTVTEPNPSGGANFVTSYTYNGINKLTKAVLTRPEGTQPRSFVWNGNDLTSETNPESGTTTYTYDNAHHLHTRTDAKGQQTKYSYDAYERLYEVQHYIPVNGQLTEDTNQQWDYYYDTNPLDPSFPAQNTWGRLAAVKFSSSSLPQNNVGPLLYEYSYNQAGRVTLQRMQAPAATAHLDATYTWDNEGRMTSLAYPLSGPTYAYAFDAMGRLSTMQENGSQVVGASYNWAGQMWYLGYDNFQETRTYNPQTMQLTRILTTSGQSVTDMTYNYPAGHNNGRISQLIDGVLGETVNYTYDAVNRLATAQATNNSWGNAYSYDGFGNLTGSTVTAGTAPHFSLSVDPTTNRLSGVNYDANGNPVGFFSTTPPTYDVENRLVLEINGTNYYDPAGKRVAQIGVISGQQNQLVYFYGITGQRLGTYALSSDLTTFSTVSRNLYFGGRLIRSGGVTVATDRLGSVRGNANLEQMRYWPYGQERTSTADWREKFATYFRDSGAGLDYADQRYYNFGSGRFQTPDPAGMAAVDLKNPTTWNMYAYANDDPVNGYDPYGLWECNPETLCAPPGSPILFPGSDGVSESPSQQAKTKATPGPGANAQAISVAEQAKAILNAERAAADRLFKPDCAGLFLAPFADTAANRAELSSQLDTIYDNGLIRLLPQAAGKNPAVPGFTSGPGGVIYIVSGGSFFTGQVNGQPLVGFAAGMTLPDFQQLVVIHEFMHWMGIVGDDDKNQVYTLPNGDQVKGSMGISAEVKKDCFN
jgi:RHS repeat-associated protein